MPQSIAIGAISYYAVLHACSHYQTRVEDPRICPSPRELMKFHREEERESAAAPVCDCSDYIDLPKMKLDSQDKHARAGLKLLGEPNRPEVHWGSAGNGSNRKHRRFEDS